MVPSRCIGHGDGDACTAPPTSNLQPPTSNSTAAAACGQSSRSSAHAARCTMPGALSLELMQPWPWARGPRRKQPLIAGGPAGLPMACPRPAHSVPLRASAHAAALSPWGRAAADGIVRWAMDFSKPWSWWIHPWPPA
ncbi:hypothetical protein T440DRAFT_95300 [Plenodomus tracheiphilus IPT5]|uniref:Uncharacterized protein n=1 Tax=Plenodomus tracheiphilus IPT5 TaxID=1408161 RepID=A0A6A7BKU5_9PLEO|nr:hypothetical protein T440DRAFT_95300 [Plenodomus tracheiphilus IPT5]